MGAASSSNVSETVSESVMDFSTQISMSSATASSSENVAEQFCSDMRIVADGDSSVSVCNSTVDQGITSSQMNENIQNANVQNDAYAKLQQKMEQAAKASISGFNLGNFSNARNVMKQAMRATTSISNDISQQCNTDNSAINRAFQKCEKLDIVAGDNAEVRACNTEVTQRQVMEQVASCQQDAVASNKAVHDLKQEAKQTAVSKTVGFDLGAIMVVMIICIAIILLVIVNGAKQFLKPAKMLAIIGAAGILLCVILVVIAEVMKNKDKLAPAVIMGTAYPSDMEFFDSRGLAPSQVQNFGNICSVDIPMDSTDPVSICQPSCVERENTNNECDASEWARSDLCTYNMFKGCYLNPKQLIGYPYDQKARLLPNSAAKLCLEDDSCAGFRWDMDNKFKNVVEIRTKMLDDKTFCEKETKDGKEVIKDPNCPNTVFSHQRCAENDMYCSSGCDPERNVNAEEGDYADVRDVCGIKVDPNTQVRTLVTTEAECISNAPPSQEYTVYEGTASLPVKKKCNPPSSACYWDKTSNRCKNKLSWANSDKWFCKTYNCLKCKETTENGQSWEPTGTTTFYNYELTGMPSLQRVEYRKGIEKEYAVGKGAMGEPSDADKEQLRCANMHQYGAVKVDPKSNRLAIANTTIMAVVSGIFGSLCLAAAAFLLIKGTQRKSLVEKIVG